MLNFIKKKHLLFILLIAFATRIIYFLAIIIRNPDGIYVYDSNGYWNIAYNLKQYGVFSQSADIPLELDYYRTPLYPIFIFLSELVGPEGFSIIFFQIIVAVLTCYFTYRIAKEITNSNFISSVAAIIVAIDVPSIVMSNLVLTETLFTFLLITCIYYFIRYLKTERTRTLILAAILCGAAILCRPIGFFLPFFLSLIMMFHFRNKLRTGFLKTGILLSLVIMSISPWLIRNKITFNHYFLSVIREHDMQNYQAAAIYAEVNNRSLAESQSILRWKTFKEFKGDAHAQPYEYAKYIESEAMKIAFQNPGLLIKHQAVQFVHFFLKPCRSYLDLQLGNWGKGFNAIPKNVSIFDYLFKHTSKLTISIVFFQLAILLISYITLIFGVLYFKINKHLLYLLLVGLIIFCFANLTLPEVTESRFRVPVVPYIAILSASGIYFLKEKFKKKTSEKINRK